MERSNLIQQSTEVFNKISRLSRSLDGILAKIDEKPQFHQIHDTLLQLTSVQEEVVNFRLQKILSEEHPYLPMLNINKLKQNKADSGLGLQQLCEDFLRERRILLKMLTTLPENSWSRTGVHEVEGHVSFGEVVRRMSIRDQQLIKQLDATLANIN